MFRLMILQSCFYSPEHILSFVFLVCIWITNYIFTKIPFDHSIVFANGCDEFSCKFKHFFGAGKFL